jgi:L-ascorbate metabolism protein UlaG (beta-lactamase superfamily)
MKITKLGHSCLVVEEGGRKIVADPGTYSSGYEALRDIEGILITHRHPDHFDVPAIKTIFSNNPGAKVISNNEVRELLAKEGVECEIVLGGETAELAGMKIQGFGDKHSLLYEGWDCPDNVGYLIAEKLYVPGDALPNPKVPVEIFALPVAGPWVKLSDTVDFARKLKPKHCFPIHDGMLREGRTGAAYLLPEKILPQDGIRFVVMKEGSVEEF